jgi:hypothetical protein
MNELQTSVQRGEVQDNSKVSAASRAMLLGGVNEEDIMAFSRQFPETPIGISMPGPPDRIRESIMTHDQILEIVRREAGDTTAKLIHEHETYQLYELSDGRQLFVRKADGWGYTGKKDTNGIYCVEREFGNN